MTKVVKCVAAVALVALIAACGNGSNTSAPTNLRFVNATQSATLSVTLNQTGQFSNVTAGTATSYVQVTPANYAIAVTGTSLATSTQTLGLASGQTYTLLAYERDGAIVALLIIEDQTTPPTGYATFEIANTSEDAGNLDVYVVKPGTTSLTGLSPSFQSVNFGAAPAASSLVAGTYDIVATATGNPADVRSHLSSLAISAGQILMAAYTSTGGGALVNSVLLTQGGTVSFSPTAQARVRVVSALPSSPPTAVTATVGTATFGNVFSPIPGAYDLVTGGSSATAYSVTAGSAAVVTGSATFAAGGDYTILVYGSASAPTVSILADNNQTPIGSNINLRLVNAAASNGAAGMTLNDNGVQVATGVQYGQASGYFGVTASSTSILQVIAPGNTPASSTQTVSLTIPDAVYTVFVIDASLTPYAIRDR